jgi:hypothetical protein
MGGEIKERKCKKLRVYQGYTQVKKKHPSLSVFMKQTRKGVDMRIAFLKIRH